MRSPLQPLSSSVYEASCSPCSRYRSEQHSSLVRSVRSEPAYGATLPGRANLAGNVRPKGRERFRIRGSPASCRHLHVGRRAELAAQWSSTWLHRKRRYTSCFQRSGTRECGVGGCIGARMARGLSSRPSAKRKAGPSRPCVLCESWVRSRTTNRIRRHASKLTNVRNGSKADVNTVPTGGECRCQTTLCGR